jgi:2-dehydropantoate 2-reductase
MLQDVRNQQQTEIDFINGYLINSANNNGFSLPINQELVKQIKELFKA